MSVPAEMSDSFGEGDDRTPERIWKLLQEFDKDPDPRTLETLKLYEAMGRLVGRTSFASFFAEDPVFFPLAPEFSVGSYDVRRDQRNLKASNRGDFNLRYKSLEPGYYNIRSFYEHRGRASGMEYGALIWEMTDLHGAVIIDDPNGDGYPVGLRELHPILDRVPLTIEQLARLHPDLER